METIRTARGGGQSPICQEFDWVVDQDGVEDVKIALSIKGRAEAGEKLKMTKCGGLFGFSNDCYVVPFPGTGDAGKNCNLYQPSFNDQIGATATVPLHLANGKQNLDQADFSCNWNKLTFGSSQTARVALPLYYEGASDPDGDGVGDLVNPYKSGAADNLILRLRTPCLPCVYDKGDVKLGVNRECKQGANPTICEDGERYVLDTLTDDKVVVQWQLSGKCEDDVGTKDCSVLPIAGDKKSAIFESAINLAKGYGTYKIIDNETIGNDVSIHPPEEVSFLWEDDIDIPPKLSKMTQPILNIFLSGSLLTDVSGNVPYLEYQLLTDEPVGMPFYKLEADVMVNGNAFIKTLYKEIKKDLVDFAIQN